MLPTPSFDVSGNTPTKYGGDITLYQQSPLFFSCNLSKNNLNGMMKGGLFPHQVYFGKILPSVKEQNVKYLT